MKNIKIITAFCLGILGCDIPAPTVTQSFETTVQVVDMNGKPIPNRKVLLLVNLSNWYSNFDTNTISNLGFGRETTDANGHVKFNYKLSSDDIVQVANIIAKDDTLYKAVTMVSHNVLSNKNESLKPEFMIKMDTLKAFKIRMKCDKTDMKSMYISVESRLSSNESSIIDRNFVRFLTETSKDTTFSVRVFSKADLGI